MELKYIYILYVMSYKQSALSLKYIYLLYVTYMYFKPIDFTCRTY